MPELLLAIDAGTTNLRVCLFTAGGELLSQASSAVRTLSPDPGRVEQDATAIWRGTRQAISRALSAAGRTAHDLAAIGVTSQRTSAVIWDRISGRPLTPLVVWSDLRGVARARELQALGVGLAPQQAAAKLEGMVAGLADHPPERLAFGNIDSFLIWKLTGGAAHVTDRSQAWPTGYLDLSTLAWNARLMELQGLAPSLFPTLCDTWGRLGTTTREGLGAVVPITADIADQQAALIGQGCETAGAAKVSYGTSATFNIATGATFLYPGPSTPPFIQSSVGGDTRFCLEGMVYSAGSALDWMRARFNLGDHRRFEALAAATPDAQGAYLLPAFQGLGAPHGEPTRRGVIGGLDLGTRAGHLARAALEGVAFRVREVSDHVAAATDLPGSEVLKVDGGLSANEVLMQVQADLLARPIARHAHREATACGAAICAARGVGLLGSAESAGFVRHDRVFEPRLSVDEAQGRLARWKVQVYGTA
ncbi:FGGY family carbohydrate kinase [Phenylobacterium ferrooxidans]|uniref:ATP:glycerol 3-phosphotransferase n=1 Tax=Phenylobacterium ferrooxidans TaxID=2982689 RepID=A0ABW6CTJ8_9CAUL